MSDLRKAAQQALEALEAYDKRGTAATFWDTITALRTALAQPEPEPVQEPHQIRSDFEQRMIGAGASPTALSRLKSGEYLSPSIQSAWDAEKKKYTTPLQRKPLTNGEIYTAYITATNQTLRSQDEKLALEFARAIEAAHGIIGKNDNG